VGHSTIECGIYIYNLEKKRNAILVHRSCYSDIFTKQEYFLLWGVHFVEISTWLSFQNRRLDLPYITLARNEN